MTGTLVYFVVVAAPASPAAAQPPAETVIRLNVHAAPAPKPALRYLLLPELREMTPGNPIPNYTRCMLDQDFTADQETFTPAALRLADRAARMDKPDWQLLPRVRKDGISLLLPDLQKMRAIATALQARFRDEIARGRFDDALVTAKTMFALSRHMGEHPTIIGSLVGIAIAMVSIAPLEEMLEQPWCPNLYWALTQLPHPLVSLEKGLEGERMFFQAEIGEKAGLIDTAPMTPEQIQKLVRYIDVLRDYDPNDKKPKTREWLDLRVKDEKHVAAARERLIEYGTPTNRVARFPAEQVVLLDEKRTYEVNRDEIMKGLNLPTWEVEAMKAKAQPKQDAGLFDFFLPVFHKVRWAQGRLETKIALLRHVEALRMYAAGHDGKFPQKLDEIGVPLPPDPFTGKPFRYNLDGATAHLRSTPPKGGEEIPTFNLHYEITIQK